MKTIRALCLGAALGLLLPAPLALGAPGDLDTTFGNGGKVVTAVFGSDEAHGMVVQPDDKIVAVGWAFNGTDEDFAVVRYLPDGTLDSSFGSGGIVTTAIGSGNDAAYGVALHADGRIVVVGRSFNGSNDDFAVATYTSSGIPAGGFGIGGAVTTGFLGGDDQAYSVAVSGGDVIVAGLSVPDFAVARYNGTSGSLDSSFGGYDFTLGCSITFESTQVFTSSTAGLVAGQAISGPGIQPGSQVAAVNSGTEFTLTLPATTTNSITATVTVGPNGRAITDIRGFVDEGRGVAVQADGKIVVVGFAGGGTNDMALVRYTASGVLDSGFGNGGIVTTQIGTINAVGLDVVLQPDGKIVVAGFAQIGGTNDVVLARYATNGILDSTFGTGGIVTTDDGGNEGAAAVALQGNGKFVVVGGANGSVRNITVARYTSGGILDASFGSGGKVNSIDISFQPTSVGVQSDGKIVVAGLASGSADFAVVRYEGVGVGLPGDADALDANVVGNLVNAAVVQPDGKTILVGSFSSVLGVARGNVARLNADGTLDMGFDPKTNGEVYAAVVQADGKIVLGGAFTTLQPNGTGAATPRNRLARVNADGTLDAAYDPQGIVMVAALALEPDGQLLVGNGPLLMRLNADGTQDSGFNVNVFGPVTPAPPEAGPPVMFDSVQAVAVQADGKVLVGGLFQAVNGVFRLNLARVNADGTLDADILPLPDGPVLSLAVQADGKVLLGGFFDALQPNSATPSHVTRNYIARINADGTLEAGFDPNANGPVASIAVQTDGSVLLGGGFTTLQPNGALAPTTRNRIARVAADGTLDMSFDPNANGVVEGIALQRDGKVLVGGSFTALQPNDAVTPIARNFFTRLVNGSATQSVAVEAARVEWNRSGAGPELVRAHFEASTDGGATWSLLGQATRIGTTPGWELAGLTLEGSGLMRARGLVSGGSHNNSSGLIEQITPFAVGVVATSVINTGGIAAAPDLSGTTTFVSFTAPEIGVSGGRILAEDGRKLDAVFNEQGEVLLHGQQAVPIDADGEEMGTIAKLMPPTGDAVLATLVRGAGVTAENDQVLFTGLQGDDPQPAVRKGQEITNLLGIFIKAFVTLDGNGETTFFSGKLKGPGMTETNNTALFGVGPAGFKLLARQGMALGGDEEVKTIATLVGQAGSLAEGRWRGGPDFIGARITTKKGRQMLYLIPADADGPDDWLLIASSGDDAAPDLPGAKLLSFKLPAYAPEAVVFDSLLQKGTGTPPIIRKNSRAVFDAQGVDIAGPITLRLLAQVAGPAPAQSNIQRFRDTLAGLGRASTVIADATLPGRSGSRTTIFDARLDGVLRPIARLGDVAPGGGRYDRFVSVVKPDGQGYGALVSALLKVAGRDEVTARNRAALFGVDSKGNMIRLLRAGDRIESAGPGSSVKPIRSFVALAAAPGSIGAARGYNADGRVNVLVTFDDRTQAVVTIQVP